MAQPPIRVLLAKLGLDTHTVGVTVIAHALRDAGMEVIFTGLKQTPEMVANTAIQEDVDVVGVSSLSAGHMRNIPLLAELLRQKGGGDKLLIVGGVIPIGWVDLVSPLGFIQQGRLRGIAVNGNARASRLPDVKLMSEQGFPFPATGWNGVFAPKNTPAPILDRLHDAINAALSTPAVQEGSRRVNVEPTQGISRPAFAKIVENDLAVWRKIVVDGNIKPE